MFKWQTVCMIATNMVGVSKKNGLLNPNMHFIFHFENNQLGSIWSNGTVRSMWVFQCIFDFFLAKIALFLT